MNNKFEDIFKLNWEMYLSRPFTLFGASLWHHWYQSKICKDLIGSNLNKGLLIENPKNLVRYYRDLDESRKLMEVFDRWALPEFKNDLEKLLREGLFLNEQAEKMLSGGNNFDFVSSVDFFTKLALLAGVLPFRVGEVIFKNGGDDKIISLIKTLRTVSYYPKVLNEIVVPVAIKEIENMGVSNKDAVNFFTFNEILNHEKVDFDERIQNSEEGKFFVYSFLSGKENVDWLEDSDEFVRKIENVKEENFSSVKGTVAFGGDVKGIVRRVLTNNLKDVEFNEGDILVSVSTSPELLSLIKKSICYYY
jgi:hypothetical protein